MLTGFSIRSEPNAGLEFTRLFSNLYEKKVNVCSLCPLTYRVWIYDQQFKGLEKESRKHYMRAFLLRRKMLLFIQNISYYMTNEVIEQHWYTFMNVIKKVCN